MKDLCLVIPVYNEERDLPASIAALHGFLMLRDRWSWEMVIADNGSTDRTWAAAQELAARLRGVEAMHLTLKGRGRALRQAWLERQAKVLAYADVDLSTDLAYLPPLVEGVLSGCFDLATGSRLLRPDLVWRSLKREWISRCYNRLLKLALGVPFSDAQCGFKAISRSAACALVPLVQDDDWFFDTELLVLAEKLGYRILDLPVAWKEDRDSRVKILSTAWADLKGVWRLRRTLPALASRAKRLPPTHE
jgi:glycosyltransferase involved in cell wall biosynthesis